MTDEFHEGFVDPYHVAAISSWQHKNFLTDDSIVVAVGLTEEVGELCRAILKRHQKIRGSYDEWTEEIKKEIGDVLIRVIEISYLEGWYPGDVLEERLKTILRRDWTKDRIGHGIS